MIFAMNRSKILMVLVFAFVTLFALLLAGGYANTPNKVFALRGTILLIFNGLILLFCWRPALRLLHKITFARLWWFPWIDGDWRAEIRSNWPKVKRTFDAARGASPPYNPLTEPNPSDAEALTNASVLIKSSLFEISIEIAPDGTDKVSRTRFVRPRWAKPDRPELSYVFEQEDYGPISVTDAPLHLGAALVKYDEFRDQLVGEYWTHRRSDVGLNTAGTILMRRVPKKR